MPPPAIVALPFAAAAQKYEAVPAQTVPRTVEMLATMPCRIDPEDIEMEEEDSNDADDMMCADEQLT
ncbi:hypothetical protein [Rubellimicrobium roseum]|uniref:Uncharacterized protein n=1 Tax=Rubellimicrobium roseum TaxID=687525 RepID=A0A5C4NGM1_9RHOB|nr:hypothetical protein [Rubellimicrobium roseum]TNC72196.1 hypothetical protein FHG71_09085 [Rubellimicrobium roseum]